MYFDEDGTLVDYKTLLSNTDRNCGGGLTPWGTWISCEEEDGGKRMLIYTSITISGLPLEALIMIRFPSYNPPMHRSVLAGRSRSLGVVP